MTQGGTDNKFHQAAEYDSNHRVHGESWFFAAAALGRKDVHVCHHHVVRTARQGPINVLPDGLVFPFETYLEAMNS